MGEGRGGGGVLRSSSALPYRRQLVSLFAQRLFALVLLFWLSFLLRLKERFLRLIQRSRRVHYKCKWDILGGDYPAIWKLTSWKRGILLVPYF